MNLNDLKQRLRNGEHLLGTMITTFANVDVIRVLNSMGFDYCILDCEHGAFTTREAADLIAVGRCIGFPVIVRIPEMRREHALHYMEMGAAGLLLPDTQSADQARMLVDCAKYAPMGHRGVSLSRPHTDFQKITDGRAYMDKANAESILMCQIESRAGVEHVEEIMAVPGVDVAFIGPNDMSQDFGVLNQYDHPEIVASFRRVIAAAKANGKWSGVHFGSAGPLRPWLADGGMQMNLWNSDSGLMILASETLKELKGLGNS